MPLEQIWLWLFGAGLAAIAAQIFIVQIPRAIREARRLIRRLSALGAIPLGTAVDRAERDLARIQRATAALPALDVRARSAADALASTRLVPLEIRIALARLGAEAAALRRGMR